MLSVRFRTVGLQNPFLAGAMMAMITWWLEAERPYSLEEINTMFQQLAVTTIEKLYAGSEVL